MNNEQKIEILKDALHHIKDHQNTLMAGKPQLSAAWHIANNALKEAGIQHITHSERNSMNA